MGYRMKAALAAAAVMLVPGALYAEPSEKWMVATEFDSGTDVVTGYDMFWQQHVVRHLSSTQNKFIGDPTIFPPNACRSVAIKWNMGIFTNKPRSFFLRQLSLAARFKCGIEFVPGDFNADLGSYDLISVTISPTR